MQAENYDPQKSPTGTPVGRQTLADVDVAVAECDKIIKLGSEEMRARLSSGGAINPKLLRELSRASMQRSKLVMRRITLLVESGDSMAMELIEKLMKVKVK